MQNKGENSVEKKFKELEKLFSKKDEILANVLPGSQMHQEFKTALIKDQTELLSMLPEEGTFKMQIKNIIRLQNGLVEGIEDSRTKDAVTEKLNEATNKFKRSIKSIKDVIETTMPTPQPVNVSEDFLSAYFNSMQAKPEVQPIRNANETNLSADQIAFALKSFLYAESPKSTEVTQTKETKAHSRNESKSVSLSDIELSVSERRPSISIASTTEQEFSSRSNSRSSSPVSMEESSRNSRSQSESSLSSKDAQKIKEFVEVATNDPKSRVKPKDSGAIKKDSYKDYQAQQQMAKKRNWQEVAIEKNNKSSKFER